MAAWLPLIKASLPYVTQIVTAAIPGFTSRTTFGKPDEVVGKQIAELQAAATSNAESIQTLAAQLKQTIEGIDAAGADLQRQLKILRWLAGAAVVVAIVAIAVAIWSLRAWDLD